jgi:hypothetical protein
MLFFISMYYISHCFIILESYFSFQAILESRCFGLFLHFRGVPMNLLCFDMCAWILYVSMDFLCFDKFLMFLLISYVFVNFLCFCEFLMFHWTSYVSLSFLCSKEFNMFQCSAFECFYFLIPNIWSSYKYYHVEMLRCQKGESASYLMHVMAKN